MTTLDPQEYAYFEGVYVPAFIKSANDSGIVFDNVRQLGRALQLVAVEKTGDVTVAEDQDAIVRTLISDQVKTAGYSYPCLGDRVRFIRGEHKGKSGTTVACDKTDKTHKYYKEDGTEVEEEKRTCKVTVKLDGNGGSVDCENPGCDLKQIYEGDDDWGEEPEEAKTAASSCDVKSLGKYMRSKAKDTSRIKYDDDKKAALSKIAARIINGDIGMNRVVEAMKQAKANKKGTAKR